MQNLVDKEKNTAIRLSELESRVELFKNHKDAYNK